MNEIWKFPLDIKAIMQLIEVEMPKGAIPIAVQVQYGIICVWAQVTPDAPKESRYFQVVGTGMPIPVRVKKYLGTVQIYSGDTVLHVYEAKGD